MQQSRSLFLITVSINASIYLYSSVHIAIHKYLHSCIIPVSAPYNAKLPNSQRAVRKNVQVDVATIKEHDTRECGIVNIFTLNINYFNCTKKDT